MKKIAFIIIFLSSSSLIGQSYEWLSIGIVRTDGIVVPTFRFEDNKWWNITNKLKKFRKFESRLRKWYFIPFTGEPYYLNVGSLVHYDPDSDISSGYGFLSDYQRSELTRNIFPVKKVGVGLSKEYPVSLFRSIDDSTTEYKMILNLVSRTKIEVDTTSRLLDFWDKHLGKNHIVDFSRISLKGTQVGTISLYYYEAYQFFGGDGCPMITYRSGWVFQNKDDYKLIGDFTGFDDCDFKQLSSIPVTPVFTININDEYFLFLIQHHWEGEEYGLVKISEDKFTSVNINYD
jgi:hypothetical protein